MKLMKYDRDYLKNIFRQFSVEDDSIDIRPYSTGHINDTYAVSCGQDQPSYILQRINHNIFTNPSELMNNVVRVTKHIRAKLQALGADDIDRGVLTVIPTNDGSNYHKDSQGNYWRVYIFIRDAQTYDVLESLEQAYEAAKAFGDFQNMLADLPEPPLYEIIPDFHNGQKRFEAFRKTLETDAHNRAKDAGTEIEFLLKISGTFDVLPALVEKGRIPVRVTHNDTKINNVMLDNKTGKGICIIDLDTVMPGLSLYDFGDIVRTSTSSAAEDECDLSKVSMEMPRFEAILKGYLSTAGRFLNDAERENLVLGGKLITLIIGTRFLTDYLNGDTYFKVHRDGHNLDRCRTQFKLVQSIIEQEDKMNLLVEKFSKAD